MSKRLLSRIMALVPVWAAEFGVVEGSEGPSVGVPELSVPLAPEPEPEPELEASAAVSEGSRLRSALRTLICTKDFSGSFSSDVNLLGETR